MTTLRDEIKELLPARSVSPIYETAIRDVLALVDKHIDAGVRSAITAYEKRRAHGSDSGSAQVKIKNVFGEVIDLALLREHTRKTDWADFIDRLEVRSLIDALEDALSVPHVMENLEEYRFGFNAALDATARAAGVIEEPSTCEG